MKSKEKIISLVITTVLVLSTVSLVSNNKAQASGGITLYVGGSGLGNYTTIESAVANASYGDTIFVYSGTYYGKVGIKKSGITLIGEDKHTTIIDAVGYPRGIDIPQGYTSNFVSGFTIKNAENIGVYLHSDFSGCCCYNTISNCIICNINRDDSGHGIEIWGQRHSSVAKNNTIINCEIYNCDVGLYLHSGIDGSSNACFNKLINSEIHDNTIGIRVHRHDGLLYGNIIKNCTICNNRDYGIYFDDNSYNNIIYHNNLFNNSLNARDRGTNIWYNSTIQQGNYWSDFDTPSEGAWDNNRDGVIDSPYNITGGESQDLYPLINPFTTKTKVYINSSKPEVKGTENFTINIIVEPRELVAGVQFDLSFDPTLISCENVSQGNFFSGLDTYFNSGIIDNINGTITGVIGLIILGNTTLIGTCAQINFTANLVNGTSALNLSNVVVGNNNAEALPIIVENGHINVIAYLYWDVNMDDKTNILDLILIGQHWMDTGTPGWNRADTNRDGIVNILDMILVGQHWTG